MKKVEDKKFMMYNIDIRNAKRLKILAAKSEITMTNLLNDIIETALNNTDDVYIIKNEKFN